MNHDDRRRIERYLSEVRKYTRNRDQADQEELLESLEEHIYEVLSDSPDMRVEDVILQMDPPHSFGDGEPASDARGAAESGGRTDANYDHLGTLDVNCKVLRSHLSRLIETLDY